jgi:hypothetical protein
MQKTMTKNQRKRAKEITQIPLPPLGKGDALFQRGKQMCQFEAGRSKQFEGERSEHAFGLAPKPTNILALFARGREIGFVWLENGLLYRYGVKTIKGKRSGSAFYKRIGKALKRLLENLRPDGIVVIERLDDGDTNSNI